MVEDTEKSRRPKATTEQKPNGLMSNAQSAGRRDGPRPGARSGSNGGQPHSDRSRSAHPQGQSSGSRPGTPGRGPRPQGAGDRPAVPGRGPRPQGQSSGSRPGTPGRGPRPQGAGDRPGFSKPAAPKAPYDEKNIEDEDIGLSEKDDAPEIKSAYLPKKNDVSNYSMSYRGSSQRATGHNTSSPNRQSKKNSNAGKPSKANSQRQSMLNTHKLAPFKYDMNEILSQSSMDPTMASSFLATTIAKASRISTKDAKEYTKTFVEAGNLTKDEFDRISKLMDRYSKYR